MITLMAKVPRVLITIRIAPTALAAIDHFADERRISRSDAIRTLLRYAVQRRDQIPRLDTG